MIKGKEILGDNSNNSRSSIKNIFHRNTSSTFIILNERRRFRHVGGNRALHDVLIKTSFTLSFIHRVLYPSIINDNNNACGCLRDLFQSFVHKIN